jgi:H/ACA ribonucleoprotein complex subunit 4
MGKLPFEKKNEEILIKKEFETNIKYGKHPEERTVEELLDYGIINLNKLDGPTSHQVSDYVKRILHINKAGHSGTLDPGVTGVLPIALGSGTRIVLSLLKAGKEYICLMHLHDNVTESKIHKTAKKFIGKIKQIPPVKSAVKRVEREREIYYLEILEIKNREVLFKVGCEAGTYIRNLCIDWAKEMGIKGHMQQLIRTKAGPFKDKDWVSLHDLKDAYEFYKEGDEKEIRKVILSLEKGVDHLPKLYVLDNAVDSLCHGIDLNVPGISKLNKFKKNEMVGVMTLKNELIAIGESVMDSESVLKENKGKVVKINKVFMGVETYPHVKRD